MHVYQVNVFGKPTSILVLGEFESAASLSEITWWVYFTFMNGGK